MPIHFKENMHRFQPYLHKIVHLVIEGMPTGDNAWEREEFQRNKMDRVFRGRGDDGNHLTLKDQDHIILGDIDEVPVQQCYQFLKSMATCTQCFNFQWCFTITLFDSNLLQLGERIINV